MTDIHEISKRSIEFLNAGYTTNSKAVLNDVLARLHGAVMNPGLKASDQIAAAEALGKLLIDPHFPNEWFESASA